MLLGENKGGEKMENPENCAGSECVEECQPQEVDNRNVILSAPAIQLLQSLLEGPAVPNRMDRARSLCTIAIQERQQDLDRIDKLYRRSFMARIKRLISAFTRNG